MVTIAYRGCCVVRYDASMVTQPHRQSHLGDDLPNRPTHSRSKALESTQYDDGILVRMRYVMPAGFGVVHQ
jgi:hypothetical protein